MRELDVRWKRRRGCSIKKKEGSFIIASSSGDGKISRVLYSLCNKSNQNDQQIASPYSESRSENLSPTSGSISGIQASNDSQTNSNPSGITNESDNNISAELVGNNLINQVNGTQMNSSYHESTNGIPYKTESEISNGNQININRGYSTSNYQHSKEIPFYTNPQKFHSDQVLMNRNDSRSEFIPLHSSNVYLNNNNHNIEQTLNSQNSLNSINTNYHPIHIHPKGHNILNPPQNDVQIPNQFSNQHLYQSSHPLNEHNQESLNTMHGNNANYIDNAMYYKNEYLNSPMKKNIIHNNSTYQQHIGNGYSENEYMHTIENNHSNQLLKSQESRNLSISTTYQDINHGYRLYTDNLQSRENNNHSVPSMNISPTKSTTPPIQASSHTMSSSIHNGNSSHYQQPISYSSPQRERNEMITISSEELNSMKREITNLKEQRSKLLKFLESNSSKPSQDLLNLSQQIVIPSYNQHQNQHQNPIQSNSGYTNSRPVYYNTNDNNTSIMRQISPNDSIPISSPSYTMHSRNIVGQPPYSPIHSSNQHNVIHPIYNNYNRSFIPNDSIVNSEVNHNISSNDRNNMR